MGSKEDTTYLMALPIVAIVGRPNVGKSSLLNCLVGRRIAIVDFVPGVTRDRVSAPLPIRADSRTGEERYVELVDTGGFGIADTDDLAEHITGQIEYALCSASLILFIVDAREGITPLDKSVAERLRRSGKPVVLVANKVDSPRTLTEMGELARLGFGEPVAVSAAHRLGIEHLIDVISERIGQVAGQVDEPVMKLAIVGKRNVGKSTFINALAGDQRVIVSEIPGTTRDSIDVRFEMDGKVFLAIDTAGVRKRSKIADDIEFYSRHRALRSIRRADVVGLMFDATVPVGRVEKQLAGYVAELFKPLVLIVNKWDLAADKASQEDYGNYLTEIMPWLDYAPIVFTTAISGEGVRETINLAMELFAQARQRVPTAEINRIFEEIFSVNPPRSKRTGKPVKVYYATQIDTRPPTISAFANEPDAFDEPFRRHIIEQLRQRLPFQEIPIRLIFRPHHRKETKRANSV